jgi:hypothetical protein
MLLILGNSLIGEDNYLDIVCGDQLWDVSVRSDDVCAVDAHALGKEIVVDEAKELESLCIAGLPQYGCGILGILVRSDDQHAFPVAVGAGSMAQDETDEAGGQTLPISDGDEAEEREQGGHDDQAGRQ